MSESLPVLITANPFSGKGKNRERVASLAAALAAHGIDSDSIWDLDERKAKLADPLLHERYRTLVSAGGDGSIAAAVNDLRAGGDPSRLPVAMLPVGNENLFAIEFGHNKGEVALADAIAALGGRPSAIDPNGGTPASDGALIASTSRYGVPSNTREELAQQDAEFRKRQARWSGFKLFPVDRYSQAYRREVIDPFPVNESFRQSGRETPTAPPGE